MDKFVEEGKAVEKDWIEFSLPDKCLEDFVFSELYEIDTKKYCLNEIFSEKAIDAILKLGAKVLTAQKCGKKLYNLATGSDAGIPPPEKYEKLFFDWERQGWIEKSFSSEGEVIVKRKL